MKLYGDFANHPEDFKNPAILNALEEEAGDNPTENQGYLT